MSLEPSARSRFSGLIPLSRRREIELREKVAAGASLYVSADDGFVRDTFEITGVRFIGRCGRSWPCDFTLEGEAFSLASSTRFMLEDGDATVLAREKNGNPVFSKSTVGKGKVFSSPPPLKRRSPKRTKPSSPEPPHGGKSTGDSPPPNFANASSGRLTPPSVSPNTRSTTEKRLSS